VGRPSQKPLVEYKGFLYQAASRKTARRVVAKAEQRSLAAWPKSRFIKQSASSRAFQTSPTSAGISRGVRVLDLGCGSREVVFLAAALVGLSDKVVGVDRERTALEGDLPHESVRKDRLQRLTKAACRG
jgi:cyclopropane fatty-acyl-phospholipid synthase-like methyltransferase